MAWSTPKTWLDNVDSLSATNLNTHLRDQLKAATEWTPYTPSWSGDGGTPVIGNGTLEGQFIAVGGLLHLRILLRWGSATTSTGVTNWRLGLPAGKVGIGPHPLTARLLDSSAGLNLPGVAWLSTASTLLVNAPSGAFVGVAAPFTWASGDALAIAGTVEM